jgi:murein L,D-transpeptidase YafK
MHLENALLVTVLLFGILEACGSSAEGLSAATTAEPVDAVEVVKSERTLTLLAKGKSVRQYKVALGGEPVGAKQQQGDHKTPEGQYVLDRRNAKSKFYKSIHVSYPNEDDRKRAERRGVDAGGDIMIHGLPNGFGWLGAMHREKDWTDGCVAVTDKEMDEIWDLVRDGTLIEIRP